MGWGKEAMACRGVWGHAPKLLPHFWWHHIPFGIFTPFILWQQEANNHWLKIITLDGEVTFPILVLETTACSNFISSCWYCNVYHHIIIELSLKTICYPGQHPAVLIPWNTIAETGSFQSIQGQRLGIHLIS